MAAGEAARADFARHWQAEFPGEPAPRMELGSVRAMERELERCRRHLRRLQRALAEERFKVGYLEAALARVPLPPPPAVPAAPRPPPSPTGGPEGSSPEGGSRGSSDAEDASSAGGCRGGPGPRHGRGGAVPIPRPRASHRSDEGVPSPCAIPVSRSRASRGRGHRQPSCGPS